MKFKSDFRSKVRATVFGAVFRTVLKAGFLATFVVFQSSISEARDSKNIPAIGTNPSQVASLHEGVFVNSDQEMILPVIHSAKKTLDIEIYQFNNPTVIQAIRKKLNEGVKVRVVKEPKPLGDKCLVFEAVQPNEDALCTEHRKLMREILAKGGEYVAFHKEELCGTRAPLPGQTSAPPCFEHGKLIISDRSVALLSTGNFNPTNMCDESQSPSRCNRDFSVVTKKSNVVKALGRVFERDLRQQNHDVNQSTASAPEVTVSPESATPLIGLIDSAKTSIRITNQYLKYQPLNEALIRAANRGVKVQILVASLCSFNRPSPNEVAKAERTFGEFDRAGIETRMFTSSIQINGKPGYLHAKAIIVDNKTVWVGSTNGSNSAMNVNREFGMFLSDASSLKKMNQIFVSDFYHHGSETWRESTVCAKDFLEPVATNE